MNLYIFVLFVHAISVLVLTAALTMESWMLVQLRRAVRPSAAHPWTGLFPAIAVAAIGSMGTILVTGAYLTNSLHSWGDAWPRLAVLEVVIYAIFGAISNRYMRAIRRCAAENGAYAAQFSSMTRRPFLKISLCTRIWVVIATTLLTAAKPGLWESLGIVGGSLVLGVLSSFISIGQRPATSTVQTSSH
jgi:hypothetical protein